MLGAWGASAVVLSGILPAGTPTWLVIGMMLVAGILAGALWGGIAGVLKARFGSAPALTEAPKGVEINHLGPEQTLSDMLDRGEIDALYSAQVPVCYRYGSKKVRRLFPDFEPVEADYYRRTRVFPIMHTVVIRREVYEQHRWIAQALTRAFEDAKSLAMNGYGMSDVFFNAPQMTPWFAGLRERVKTLMGDDFWPYGVAPNRKTLETCLRYHYEQGLTKKLFKVEELFAPETMS